MATSLVTHSESAQFARLDCNPRRFFIRKSATLRSVGFFIAWVAAYIEMPQVALVISALAVCVLGEVFACVVDRTTGYFQCGHCQKLFVPDVKTYMKGSWSVLPGSARFTCPHCGKTGKCRRQLER